jgi:hypothetical protein
LWWVVAALGLGPDAGLAGCRGFGGGAAAAVALR